MLQAVARGKHKLIGEAYVYGIVDGVYLGHDRDT